MGWAWRTWPTGAQNAISGDLAVATNMRVDIWDQESVQDFLQLDHRNFHGEIVAVEIVAILGEERQRREERKR